MLIVNKTMNEVGFIIEDYNGFTEHKEEELAKLLKNLKVTLLFIFNFHFSIFQTAHNEEMSKHHMKPVKELYYEAMKKCDEDKPGMALELGMNMFADGNPILSDLVRQLLISAYTRCDRDLFAEILDAHLKVSLKTNLLLC